MDDLMNQDLKVTDQPTDVKKTTGKGKKKGTKKVDTMTPQKAGGVLGLKNKKHNSVSPVKRGKPLLGDDTTTGKDGTPEDSE